MQIIQPRILFQTLTFILGRATSLRLHAQRYFEISTYSGHIDSPQGTLIPQRSWESNLVCLCHYQICLISEHQKKRMGKPKSNGEYENYKRKG